MGGILRSMTRFAATVCYVILGLSLAIGSPHPTLASQSEASRKVLQKAAERGSAPAQYALGAGAEAEGDYAAALEWFTKAAEQGYAPAHFKLGVMHDEGKGVERDPAKAGEWYRSAAALGSSEAASRLRDRQSSEPPLPTAALPATADAGVDGAAAAPSEQPAPDAAEPGQSNTPPSTQPILPESSGVPNASAPLESPEAPSTTPSSDASQPSTTSGAVSLASSVLHGLLVGASGVLFLLLWIGLTRPAVMKWYRSGAWFIQGNDASSVMRNHIRLRMQVEGLAMFFACLPCLALYWLGRTMLGLA